MGVKTGQLILKGISPGREAFSEQPGVVPFPTLNLVLRLKTALDASLKATHVRLNAPLCIHMNPRDGDVLGERLIIPVRCIHSIHNRYAHVCTHIYEYICVCLYAYIERERERKSRIYIYI